MTTEDSMESLDRAVEEARAELVNVWIRSEYPDEATAVSFERDLDALIEAVSAKARAEERERPFEGVTRFEVIDYRLRAPRIYSAWNVEVKGAYQDGGHTFKAFIRSGRFRSSEEAGG